MTSTTTKRFRGKHHYIPDDIILEILKELPVKYLLQFRCVSKRWRSMINDPLFIEKHRLRSHHRPDGVKLLLEHKGPKTKKQNFVLMDQQCNAFTVPHPIGSNWVVDPGMPQEGVEGLICFADVIWNPTTRKRIVLPRPRINYSIDVDVMRIGKGQHSRKLFNYFYLGFDAAIRQYKVLSICRMLDPTNNLAQARSGREGFYQIHVLTLGTNNLWRNVTGSCFREEDTEGMLITSFSIYVKNKIYFLVDHPQNKDLMVFSVKDETFRFLHLPKGSAAVHSYMLVEVSERVGMLEWQGKEIWVLIDPETEEWEKMVIPTKPRCCYWPKPLIHLPVVSINTTELLFQEQEKDDDPLRCYFWDMKTLRTRRGPSVMVKRGAAIWSKHVETLFDPTVLENTKWN